MDDLLRDFLTESNENLLRLDQEVVELEKNPGDLELLKSIFRTIHTIKGTCGFLDLVRLESVAHSAENVLGLLRDGELAVTPEVISDVLAAVDVVKEILDGLEASESEPAGDDAQLIGRLNHWVAGKEKEEVDPAEFIAKPPEPAGKPKRGRRKKAAASGEPEEPKKARKPRAPRRSAKKAAPADDEPRIGDLLVQEGKVKRSTVEAVAAGKGDQRLGDALVASGAVSASEVEAVLKKQKDGAESTKRGEGERASVADSSLRVNVEILDLLMNLAGELVLTRNQLVQLAQEDDNSRYAMPLQHLNRVTSDLQEAVMKTRMQPIGNAWSKLPRLVRDLCQMSGKKIDLLMSGQETELDRQILQAIQDPLTHMIRNSADHGIEPPAARRAAGKPDEGTIRLDAFHEGGQIIIEIRDDGKGLDVVAIREKAIAQGLVKREQAEAMTDSQIFKFIFEPGFSTAEKITNVSGRGVGMDVVRSNIERIGGAIELTSARGKGTTFRIKIPLTLAILSALIVGAGAQSFAIPQIGVLELVRVGAENRSLIESINGTEFFRLRETLLPIVRLGSMLQLPRAADEGVSIVVCQIGANRFGLVVDEIFDTHEIVVKPIGRMVKGIPFYSGTTILGDGRVIMILDVPSIAGASHLIDNVDETEQAADATADHEEEDRMPLVIFRSGGETRQAVPLALVSRLEKIPAEAIEYADGRWLVQYRDSLLPLVPASAAVEMRAPGARPVIVFTDGERHMGLAVEEIHDIVEDQLRLQMESATPGILGTAVIAGRSTEVVDINSFLRGADPDWFGARKRNDVRKRVLLIDDSPFFLNLVGPALRASNYEVVMAADGQEALARLEDGEIFDVIVSDIDMPRIDGFEFARRVSANPVWGRVPLIALTGRNGTEDRSYALELGFDEFLRKFDRDAVLAALESITAAPDEALV
ncbi:MAG TPA: hybrid sensor histidine kinase/response regulator [Longimicrobiaceae bacterium]|nr:hybrid sensor histidine kinase/response regulator [Longimicrobiaceae bacterium]